MKFSNKSRWMRLLALVLALGCLVGCAAVDTPADQDETRGEQPQTFTPEKTEPEETEPEQTEPEILEYTIRVWTPAEDQAEDNNWLVKMEERFAAAHPEWKINWFNETIPEVDAAGVVAADIAAGADVYMFPQRPDERSDSFRRPDHAGGQVRDLGQGRQHRFCDQHRHPHRWQNLRFPCDRQHLVYVLQ